MKTFLLILCIGFAPLSKAQPPNNAIFYGGSGDGTAQNQFALAPTLIFLGGSGDGIAASTNNALHNQVFLGGIGDGFARQHNNAVSNTIFYGSTGDGFAADANASNPNAIFKGGVGDGWHTVILPLGPLPVELLSFTAEHNGRAHLLKWITISEVNTRHFEIQRSANGSSFETIGMQTATGAQAINTSYTFRVERPWTGNNFYRLKMMDTNGSHSYSPVVLLRDEDAMQLSIYPNPAADVLYIKLPAQSTPLLGTPAYVFDAKGKTVLQTHLQFGSINALSIKALPAGMYIIQCNMNGKPFALKFLKSN